MILFSGHAIALKPTVHTPIVLGYFMDEPSEPIIVQLIHTVSKRSWGCTNEQC